MEHPKRRETMTYVDGFVIPVPHRNKAAYEKLAAFAAPIFIEYGAIHVVENWGDDLMKGEVTDFYKAANAEDDENIVFSWITWPDKAARDKGNERAMADERFTEMMGNDIFSGKRMIYSGFQTIVDVKG
jgi:uncharacterized protein YbaA (DUF1428 family)